MNPTAMTTLETQSLIESVCAGMADDDQVRHLESILLADEGARKYYVYLRDLDANLRWLAGARRDGGAAAREFRIVEQTPPQRPSPTLPSTALHGTGAYFSAGWPVAYLIATVIFGIAGLIAAFTCVSQSSHLALESGPVIHVGSTPQVKYRVVGQITGMAGCRLVGNNRVSHEVALGTTYQLAAGLLEITYDTGAKVILQGPVRYEVDSVAGGYLAAGKLTATLEQRSEVGNQRSEPANPQSGIGNRTFAVRTPTAVVTDLGTEFGVEVDEAGRTTSHVFRGKVNLRATATDGSPIDAGQVLHAGESARVNNDGKHRIVLLGNSTEPADFVRTLSKTPDTEHPPLEVVACWQFDGQNFLTDSSGHGHTLVNRGTTQVDGAASFNGAAMLKTIDSVDLTPYKRLRVSWSQRAVGPFTEEIVWEQTSNYCHTPGAIVSHLTAQEGYTGVATQHLGKESYRLESYPVVSDTWEHFVMECDLTAGKRSGIVKVFKNGMLIGRGTPAFGPAPASFVNAPIFIGSRDGLIAPFVGQIDNLKIEGEPVKKGR